MSLDRIEQLLADQPKQPPIERWDPPLSGEIDIRIDAEAVWYHEGDRIQREPLVKLFASILRCESDGEYYLVTPVEKWRIVVEDTPFLVVGFEDTVREGQRAFLLQHNLGRSYWLDRDNALVLAEYRGSMIPRQLLPRGLSARLNRNVYYGLVDAATVSLAPDGRKQLILDSCGTEFPLGWLDD